MGLNDLHLSPDMIASLYPCSLVNLDNPWQSRSTASVAAEITKQPETIIETAWKFLGNNQKNILIVVNYDSAVHLPDEDLNFLINMLAACKLSLGDVAVVNKNNYKETGYKEFLAHFKSRIMLLFDVKPVAFGLPVSFPFFQVQSVVNCIFLYAPALEQQRNDALLKSKLWVSLRSVFGI